LSLVSNPPDLEPVSITYGPVELPEPLDTITIFLASAAQPEHEHTLKLQTEILDTADGVLADAEVRLIAGEQAVSSLTFSGPPGSGIQIRLALSFARFVGGKVYGRVELPYVLAYRRNPLVDLFNAAGSDKGTEIRVGAVVLHCYALYYYTLL